MGEKQFTFGAVSPNVAMIKDNGEPMDIGEVVDCLNEQQTTIKQLKEENEQLRQENTKLKKEVEETVRWTGYE